ncbi:CoA pyrophosphatase [Maritimibacter sp. DP4N28-5]|uniref:CoA pyrophosphatase n=1 Tax=Maritimibacter dapengensis TaxID=2836868 RepID=A0ABS6T474_9RHOB|nr:CoA pyrophosphatase [Maritimibacter dapengensis]
MHRVAVTDADKAQAALERAVRGGRGSGSSDFDLNPQFRPKVQTLRPAGVLVPFYRDTRGGLSLILTQRSSALKHHPGQIAFPGGKVDPVDTDEIAAAMREADEEIGLAPDNVEIIGTLPPHETITAFNVTPVVGLVREPFVWRPERGEVAEIFSVPFDHVMNPERYVVEGRYYRGVKRHYFTVPWGPYYIWGATARMLRVLADRVAS